MDCELFILLVIPFMFWSLLRKRDRT